jgi:hypothetical protein
MRREDFIAEPSDGREAAQWREDDGCATRRETIAYAALDPTVTAAHSGHVHTTSVVAHMRR